MFYENHIAKLTLKSCEGKVTVEKASIVYKQEITAMNERTPWSTQKCAAVKEPSLQSNDSKHLSHDSLYNLHEFGYDMPGR